MLNGYSRALTAQLFVAALLAAGVSAAASAKTKLVYSTYLTANHVINTKAMKPFFDGVAKATDGGLTFDLVAGGSLSGDRRSPRLNSSHECASRFPSSACKNNNL